MAWEFPGDRIRLTRALALQPQQAWPGSTLQVLMDLAEQYDSIYGTGTVPDVQALLTTLEANLAVQSAGTASDEQVQEIDVQGDITVTYKPTSSPAARLFSTIAGQRQAILNILDPSQQLAQYQNRSRLIGSL